MVWKQTVPDCVLEPFSFSGDAVGNIADGGTIDVEVAARRYTTTEAATDGWVLDGFSCDDNNSSGSGQTAALNIEAGETVTCTCVNRSTIVPPPAVPILARNGWALLLLTLALMATGWKILRPESIDRPR